jgi:hypothetical protein
MFQEQEQILLQLSKIAEEAKFQGRTQEYQEIEKAIIDFCRQQEYSTTNRSLLESKYISLSGKADKLRRDGVEISITQAIDDQLKILLEQLRDETQQDALDEILKPEVFTEQLKAFNEQNKITKRILALGCALPKFGGMSIHRFSFFKNTDGTFNIFRAQTVARFHDSSIPFVPAPLRSKHEPLPYSDNPCNFHTVTTTPLGATSPSHTIHRGGQFASVESAKKTIVGMLETADLADGRAFNIRVNALLSPGFITRDWGLLEDHKNNIDLAVIQIKAVFSKKDTELSALEKEIKDRLTEKGVSQTNITNLKVSVSNIGVNWIAQNTRVRTAYQTFAVNNPAILHINENAKEMLSKLKHEIETSNGPKKIDAINKMTKLVNATALLHKMWANNAFNQCEDIANNEFFYAAQQVVVDILSGATVYVDCMSGKDRTAAVMACAESILHTMDDRIALHEKSIDDLLKQSSATSVLDENDCHLLTSSLFKITDIKEILRHIQTIDKSEISDFIKSKAAEKITSAERLVMAEDFLAPKHKYTYFLSWIPILGQTTNIGIPCSSAHTDLAESALPLLFYNPYLNPYSEGLPHTRLMNAESRLSQEEQTHERYYQHLFHRNLFFQMTQAGHFSIHKKNIAIAGAKLNGPGLSTIFSGFCRKTVKDQLRSLPTESTGYKEFEAAFSELTSMDMISSSSKLLILARMKELYQGKQSLSTRAFSELFGMIESEAMGIVIGGSALVPH